MISYDPNVRAALLGDTERGRQAVERSVGIAHLVKASREDVEWLYPKTPIEPSRLDERQRGSRSSALKERGIDSVGQAVGSAGP